MSVPGLEEGILSLPACGRRGRGVGWVWRNWLVCGQVMRPRHHGCSRCSFTGRIRKQHRALTLSEKEAFPTGSWGTGFLCVGQGEIYSPSSVFPGRIRTRVCGGGSGRKDGHSNSTLSHVGQITDKIHSLIIVYSFKRLRSS